VFFLSLQTGSAHTVNYLNLISESRVHALNLIDSLDRKTFLYHDSYHTTQVVRVTEQLSLEEGLDRKSAEHLSIAAWFHDTGYTDLSDHEQQSTVNANSFLQSKKYDSKSTENISRLILATKISHDPTSKDEEIIRDADLHYLGLENYEERANLLRLEWELCLHKKLTDKEWYQENINFFESHRFYTASAQTRFDRNKSLNLEKIKHLLPTS
jgi:predicted metal-dependent HD superfamily phosphohydrolase